MRHEVEKPRRIRNSKTKRHDPPSASSIALRPVMFDGGPIPFIVEFLPDRALFVNARSKYTSEPVALASANGCCSDFDCHFIIGVFDGRLGTLVHEVGHAALKIMFYHGIPVTKDTQEILCLVQGFIFEQILKSAETHHP